MKWLVSPVENSWIEVLTSGRCPIDCYLCFFHCLKCDCPKKNSQQAQ